MDDFNVSSLHESKNEWGARLLTILTPLVIEGMKSIFDESYNLCKNNNEHNKYLMTFQNFIARIPNWNPSVIEQETKRIIEKSRCGYLEDLITCVHIIQLKILTSIRVGQKQKKIDIHIPKLEDFVHKCYISVARKVYKNVYLFEITTPPIPLQIQKHNRELEIIVQECILNTIRESIPIENILKAYMDETIEEDVVEEIKEQIIETAHTKEEEGQLITETVATDSNSNNETKIKFNDMDSVRDLNNKEQLVNAPKDISTLEEISNLRNDQRKLQEEDDDDDNLNGGRLTISDEHVDLNSLDLHIINANPLQMENDILLDDIEILT